MADIDRTSFLSGGNAEFIAELYTRYLEDPASVDPSWRRFFADIADDPAAIRAERGAGAGGTARRSGQRGGRAAGGDRLDPSAEPDPLLSGARPSRSRSRSL